MIVRCSGKYTLMNSYLGLVDGAWKSVHYPTSTFWYLPVNKKNVSLLKLLLFYELKYINKKDYYMAMSHKDWELPNSRI